MVTIQRQGESKKGGQVIPRRWNANHTIASICGAFILLACLVGFVGSSLVSSWNDYGAYTQRTAEAREAVIAGLVEKCLHTFPNVLSAQQCLRNSIKEIEEDLATNKDLEAQRDMAFWAMWTFIAGAGSVLLAGAGFVGLLLSLKYNRDATKAAVLSSEATRDALHVNRAWICHTGIEHRNLFGTANSVHQVPVSDAIFASITWKNAGNTPALNLSIAVKMIVTPANSGVPEFEKEAPPSTAAAAVLGPGDFAATNRVFLNDAQTKDFRARKIDWFIYGVAEYVDVFDPTKVRTSEVCVVAVYQGTQTNPTPEGHFVPQDVIVFQSVGRNTLS